MNKFVVMSGGFHPFHAGHASLYQQAKETFPDATVLVCATNVQTERPFPFELKKKLAQLSGVPSSDFIQVSRQFSAEDPGLLQRIGNLDDAIVIFVRSSKDRNEQPQGLPLNPAKDKIPLVTRGPNKGKPQKLLDYDVNKNNLLPASQHTYMAYLKTVEFGPGITSASEIRNSWPKLNDKRKLAMVYSLYPATKDNVNLAKTVIKMFDEVMGGQVTESLQLDEGLGDYITKKIDDFLDTPKVSSQEISRLMKQAPSNLPDDVAEKLVAKFMETEKAKRLAQQAADANKTTREKIVPYLTYFGRIFVDRWKQIPQKDRDNALKNLVHNIGRFLLFILEVLAKGLMKKESVAEELQETVGGNYLYHATGAEGLMGILKSNMIKAAAGPQKATQAQTDLPTVSLTRDWGYASGSNATAQDGGVGRHAVLVLDRNAIETRYKTLATSQSHDIRGQARSTAPELAGRLKMRAIVMKQPELKGQHKKDFGTAKAGGEFEEAVVVPKGALPISDSLVGFWVNPKSPLINDPTVMSDPRRLEIVGPNKFVKASAQKDVSEDKSKVIAKTASDLINPPKIMQHRSKRDSEREEMYRNAQLGRDDLDDELDTDLEVQQLMRKAQQHYPQSRSKQQAFIKFAQRALKHSEEEDEQQDIEIQKLKKDVNQIKSVLKNPELSESIDYLEEK